MKSTFSIVVFALASCIMLGLAHASAQALIPAAYSGATITPLINTGAAQVNGFELTVQVMPKDTAGYFALGAGGDEGIVTKPGSDLQKRLSSFVGQHLTITFSFEENARIH